MEKELKGHFVEMSVNSGNVEVTAKKNGCTYTLQYYCSFTPEKIKGATNENIADKVIEVCIDRANGVFE